MSCKDTVNLYCLPVTKEEMIQIKVSLGNEIAGFKAGTYPLTVERLKHLRATVRVCLDHIHSGVKQPIVP